MKVWHAIEVEMARVAETAVAGQLWAAGTTGIEVSEDAPERITLRAYFDRAPEVERVRAQIGRALRLADLPEAAVRRLEALTVADQDWLAEWKKGYEPVAVGERLLVTPSWKRDRAQPAGRLVIQIDPGMAFGTGTHETTRGCLELLEKYWRGGRCSTSGPGPASSLSRRPSSPPARASSASTSTRRRSPWPSRTPRLMASPTRSSSKSTSLPLSTARDST